LYVEPVPHFAALCRQRHGANAGVQVAECAVGAAPGRATIRVAHAFTSLHADVIARAEATYRQMPPDQAMVPVEEIFAGETVEVEIVRLDALLPRHGVAPGFEVMVVDVEGHEAAVFDSFDLAAWRPQMLIVELLDRDPRALEASAAGAALRSRILSAGYAHLHVDEVNTVFVRAD
jgi:FkbM family methyltransferase